jgi:deoxyribonuclease IV
VRPIGAHAPVSGGIATGALRYAAAVGAEAIQIFVANPRGWAQPAGDDEQAAALAERVARTGLPVFVHAPYLINLGTPDAALAERGAAALRHSLRRGALIGARGVVVHTGSATAGSAADAGSPAGTRNPVGARDRDAALARVRQSLLPVLDELGDSGPDVLLEPMAGQGQMLCSLVTDLGPYLEALDWHPRANVCLDLCHVFAAGHDLADPGGVGAAGGVARMLEQFEAVAGRRLRLVHANDSADGCGSRRDRHAAIGTGQIGLAAFAELLTHPATAGVPFVVETPGGERGQAADIATLRRLRDGGLAAVAGSGQRDPAHSGGPSPSSS